MRHAVGGTSKQQMRFPLQWTEFTLYCAEIINGNILADDAKNQILVIPYRIHTLGGKSASGISRNHKGNVMILGGVTLILFSDALLASVSTLSDFIFGHFWVVKWRPHGFGLNRNLNRLRVMLR